MNEFIPFVLVGAVGLLFVVPVLVGAAILVYQVVVREQNKLYLQAYQEFLEQKSRVEERLRKH